MKRRASMTAIVNIKSAKPLPKNPDHPPTAAMLMPTMNTDPMRIMLGCPVRSDRIGPEADAMTGAIASSGSRFAGGEGVHNSVIYGPPHKDCSWL